MLQFFSYLINGISLGSVYAIIALGYSMVYGIAKMLNFAHGDVIMIGAYIAFCATQYWGMSPLLGVLIAMIVCTVLGMVIERLAYKPGNEPCRADYRHRRELPAAKPGAAGVRPEPHVVPVLRQHPVHQPV